MTDDGVQIEPRCGDIIKLFFKITIETYPPHQTRKLYYWPSTQLHITIWVNLQPIDGQTENVKNLHWNVLCQQLHLLVPLTGSSGQTMCHNAVQWPMAAYWWLGTGFGCSNILYTLPLILVILNHMYRIRIFTSLNRQYLDYLIRSKDRSYCRMAFHAHMGMFEFRDEPIWFETKLASFHGFMNNSLQPYIQHFTVKHLKTYSSAREKKNWMRSINEKCWNKLAKLPSIVMLKRANLESQSLAILYLPSSEK